MINDTDAWLKEEESEEEELLHEVESHHSAEEDPGKVHQNFKQLEEDMRNEFLEMKEGLLDSKNHQEEYISELHTELESAFKRKMEEIKPVYNEFEKGKKRLEEKED